MNEIEIVPYTVWNEETGEVDHSGRCVINSKRADEGFRVHYGEEVDWNTHVFNLATGLPVAREAPRAIDLAEISGAVNRERQRRIEQGKSFNGILVTGSDKDVSNLTNLAIGAQLRVALGDTTQTMFRDGNNELHSLSPSDVIWLWQMASAYVQSIYEASWELKKAEPFPHDFQEDSYWPAQ